MPADAYVDGLKLAAGRELSEAQVRQRLARKGHSPADVDAAVSRLKDESTKRRGKLRVRMQIERAGIAAATARKVVDEVFNEIDADALLEAALTRRLLGRDRIEDDREFQRLYRYLLNQGFDSDRVINALQARRRK
jgi:regulatory protein